MLSWLLLLILRRRASEEDQLDTVQKVQIRPTKIHGKGGDDSRSGFETMNESIVPLVRWHKFGSEH